MLQQHKEENKNKRGKSETQEVAKRREAKVGDEMMGEEDPKVTADHRPEERDQARASRFFYLQWEKQP